MSSPPVIDVTDLIDRRPMSIFQIMIVVLCGLVALLDGFDLLAIGVAGPNIAASLHISPEKLGVVFSIALLGLILGAFGCGPLGDRFGRKRILVGATVAFGVFTLCTALATSVEQLLLWRFCAGVGLGGAMPSFISLASEYVPRAKRSAMVGLLWTGFPIGSALVGLLGPQLIDAFGWQVLFYIGGVLPLLLAGVLCLLLPESVSFLVTGGAAPDIIARSISRIDPTAVVPPEARFTVGDDKIAGVSVSHLFGDSRAAGTGLLWASYFATFLMLVTNQAWAPTLLQQAGINLAHSALATAIFALGSIVGTSLAGFLVGRFGARAVLPIAFVASAFTLGAVGHAASSITQVITLEGFAGLFLGVGSSGLIALAAQFYPTAIRATGIGWAMGLGRLGSLVGPLVVGILVGRGWYIGSTFVALAAPALAAALFTSMIGAGRFRDGIESAPLAQATDSAAIGP
jgi:AAHS family 4-hydroxybenzoate transporter-like MFS transporter